MTNKKINKKFNNLKHTNGKKVSVCNYCQNLISINKLNQCHECKRFYENAYEKKLKVNGELVVKNKTELTKLTEDNNRYCDSCVTKIRTNKYLCPNCLIKFCNNDVILFIEK